MRLKSIAFASLALIFTGSPAAAQSVAIATGEYEPMTSQSAENGGLVTHLIAVAFEEAGYDVSFEFMPWKRAIELTRRGDFPASSYWYHSAEREAEFIHAGPLFEERLFFFRLISTDEPRWEELSDLAGLRIGVVDGYTYTPELWRLGEEGVLTLDRGPTDEANLRKLLAGRIDLYPISEPTGRQLLQTVLTAEEAARIAIVEQPLSTATATLLVSRAVEDAEQIAADFDAALERLRARGAAPEVMSALTAD